MAIINKQTNEISWINYIKVFSMIIVYLNHSEYYYEYNLMAIDSIYEPVFVNSFFVISGYLLFKKQLSSPIIDYSRVTWLKDKGLLLMSNVCYKIIIPSILFSSVLFFPKVLIRGQEIEIQRLLNETVLGGSLWFTSALAVAEVLLFFMLLSRKKSILIYLLFGLSTAFVSFILLNYNIVNNPRIPWYFCGGMSAVLLMALGGVYWKYEDVIDNKIKYSWILIGLLLIYCIVCIMCFDSYCGPLHTNPLNLQSIPIIIVGVYCVIWICKRLPNSSIVNYMGRRSIGFYFMSGATTNTMAIIINRITDNHNTLLLLIVWALSYVLGVGIVFLLNRFIPCVFDFRLCFKK